MVGAHQNLDGLRDLTTPLSGWFVTEKNSPRWIYTAKFLRDNFAKKPFLGLVVGNLLRYTESCTITMVVVVVFQSRSCPLFKQYNVY